MSDVEVMLQSEYMNPDATRQVVAGSIPIGDYEQVPADKRQVFESFQVDVQPVTFPAPGDNVIDPVPATPKKRGPGRPKKNILTESDGGVK